MNEPFYSKGLRFSCTRCSACCRLESGFVFLNSDDFSRLMLATGLSREEFFHTFCRAVSINGFKRISLTEKPDYDCIFWGNEGCEVYADRPLQCASYPFWPAFLSCSEEWESLRGTCPGVDKGKLHSHNEIENWLLARRLHPYLTDLDFSDILRNE